MGYHAKKLLCYTAITAILNSSIQPLYAVGFNHPKIPEDLAAEEHHQQRPRLLALDDYLQEKIKTSANSIQAWTPDFIKGPLSSAYKQVCSWLESQINDLKPSVLAKTPLEIDYAHDLTYWRAHYRGAIEELKDSALNKSDLIQERLEELQDIVWSGMLSPYHYEQGLKELTENCSPQILQQIQEELRKALKASPSLISAYLQKDIWTSFQAIQSSSIDIEEFKNILTYYRSLENPLDYKQTLSAFRAAIQQNKKTLSLTVKQYRELNAALNEAINKNNSKEERHALKANRAFIVRTSQELPYKNTTAADIAEDTFNSSLPPLTKKEPLKEESFSFIKPIKGITKLAYKGMKYAVEHPVQAITIGLASQVAAAAAIKVFSAPKPMEEKDRKQDSTRNSFEGKEVQTRNAPSGSSQESHSFFPRYSKRAIGDEFQINQNSTFGHQHPPTVTSIIDGSVFVAWSSGQAGNEDIYARIFSANGTAVANEFNINQITASTQMFPSVAGLRNGHAFVAWEGNQEGNWDAYGRIFSANGSALSNEFIINQDTTTHHFWPSVTGLTNGNVFVTWFSAQAGDNDIYGRFFSVNGTALNNEFRINQNTASNQYYCSAVNLSNGNVFITWQGLQTGNWDIYGRIFSENGTALGNDFGMNHVTTNNQQWPQITDLTNGNVFAVWYGDQAGFSDIYGRVFSENGTALSNEFRINEDITLHQYWPSVTGLTNSNVFVTWYGTQTGNSDIYGRLFSENGTALSNEFSVNQITSSDQQYPFVTRLTNGTAFVAWVGNQIGNYNTYGRIFTNEALASLILPSSTATAGTTGFPLTTSPTSTPQTTGSSTIGDLTTGLMTTGRVTTGLNAATTSLVDSDSSSSSSSNLSLIIGATVGGTALCIGGVPLAYYLYKRNKQSDQNDDIELMKRATSAPFAPADSGFTEHPSFVGGLKDRSYAIWKELSEDEAKILQPRVAKKIPHFPSSTDKVRFDLGKGKFGATYAGSDIETRDLYAIKEVYGRDAVDESLREGELQDELKGSSQVISLVDYKRYEPTKVTEQPRLFQVMPLAYTNGVGYKEMFSLLKGKEDPLHERLAVDNLKQLMTGLNYMHSQGIYHLDIKDENILYMSDGTLRIADFGRARKLETSDRIADNKLGDKRKFSPEQLAFIRHQWKQEGKEVGGGELVDSFSAKMADTWAGGLYTLELWLKVDPFSDSETSFQTKVKNWTNASFERVLDGITPLIEATSKSFAGILRQVLAVDYKKRMEPIQAVKDLSSFKSLSSKERTKAFEKLIALSKEGHRPGRRVTEASSITAVDAYSSTTSREENENYKYDNNSPAVNLNATSNSEGKVENKYHFLPGQKK